MVPTESRPLSSVSDDTSNLECEERGPEEVLNITQCCSGLATRALTTTFATLTEETDEDQENVITSIRATDVAFPLRRLPAGFYAAVQHSSHEWRTGIKSTSVTDNIVGWDGPIPIPSDFTATVCLLVYASFEFQPLLGHGEELRRVEITVKELFNHSANEGRFVFRPEDGDVISPCSSILVTVERQLRGDSDSPASRVLDVHSSVTDSPVQVGDATNQGHTALARYRKHGERLDLERSIGWFELALDICPQESSCHAAAQSNLAMAKFILCQIDDTNPSFDVPLTLYRNALGARPVGHPDRPSTLIQLAVVHFARFQKRQEKVDATQAEALLHEAMSLTPTGSHEKRAAVFVLEMNRGRNRNPVQPVIQWTTRPQLASGSKKEGPSGLLHRFRQLGQLPYVQQVISGLMNLGGSLSNQSVHVNGESDFIRDVNSVSDGCHPIQACRLNNLGNAYFTRFKRLGEMADLDQVILRQRDAVDITPDDHPHKSRHLINLGDSFFARFQRLGELDDLDQMISRYKDAVHFTPDGHRDKPCHLNNLGRFYFIRFKRLGDPVDLDQAISRQRDAVDITPRDHHHKSSHLGNLGDSLNTRFRRLRELGDLEEAIVRYREGIDFTSEGHPERPCRSNNLGNSYSTRFGLLGDLIDLDQAILWQTDAVNVTPDDHPHKPNHLRNLGDSFLARFRRLSNPSDLEEAISRHRAAVDLAPDGHSDKPVCLNNLCNSLITRFQHIGRLDDLEEAIVKQRNAVDLTPDNHPEKLCRLASLGNYFKSRFERLGDPTDLKDAISSHKDVVDLTPVGHSHRSNHLRHLGGSYYIRFKHFGELVDLDEAISKQRHSITLIADDNPSKPCYLNDLALSLLSRFKELDELSDLEQAIAMATSVVELTPDGHFHKSGHLDTLGICLRMRFRRLGEISDLEQAILRQSEAVELTPDSHAYKPRLLDSLADCFEARFWRLSEPGDIERAVLTQRRAANLIPDGQPDKPNYLNTLANRLLIRFRRFHRRSDLEEAILTHRAAVELTPEGHTDKSRRLDNLAHCFESRFGHFGDPNDLEEAILLWSQAACASVGPATIRFHASQNWISAARTVGHRSLLDAYSTAISLLPRLAWIGLSLTRRYSELLQGANVVREAAAAVLDSGSPDRAVEWLEQGRSIVWGELFQLRSSYEELSSAHPDQARRLRELSIALEHSTATHEKSLSSILECGEYRAPESLEQEAIRHRALATERDKLLQEVRGFPGFERFLLHKEFSQLRASAHSAPVVILNAAENRCDALIILADKENAVHVPLPAFDIKRCGDLQSILDALLGPARLVPSADRAGRPVLRKDFNWESILSTLWKGVVKPVLDILGLSTPGDISRIFWCPTGPFTFLPIHAAGLYGTQYLEPWHKVFDFVISSYVPTLSILTQSIQYATSSDDFRVLAVPQPSSDGQSRLPGVRTELECIKEVMNNFSTRTTLLESSDGTVEEVLSLMKDATWVHFACHGIQDSENPSNSGLCLADERRLKLSDMVSLSRPRGGLAFLSACQTAMGDKKLSDEAVHIAAGMLFAGYGSVIGTMWSISDRVAPRVAKDVYEELFQAGVIPECRNAAQALHNAVGRLRDTNASFVEWVPFIHVGL